MSNKKLLPSLSETAWIDDSKVILDTLFSHAFLSDYNQTSLFPGYVTSIAYIIQKNTGSITSTAREVKDALTEYFSSYFNNVNVEVTYSDASPTDSSSVTLTILATMTDSDGVDLSLGKIIESDGVKITKILSLNNSGVET